MKKIFRPHFLLFLGLFCCTAHYVMAFDNNSIPVAIEYEVPANLKAGDVVTTKIQLTALTNIKNLRISTDAYEGVQTTSIERSFSSLRKGERQEVEVTVRLLNDLGYLSLFVTVETMIGVQSAARAIRYGTLPANTSARRGKLKPMNKTDEQIIFLPGEKR